MINLIKEILVRRKIKQALKEVKLHKQGKIKLSTWDELQKKLKGV